MQRSHLKEEAAKYEAKISALRVELEAVARQLSERGGERDQLQSELGVLGADRSRLTAQVAGLEARKQQLGLLIEGKTEALDEVLTDIASRQATFLRDQKTRETAIQRLDDRIEEKKTKLQTEKSRAVELEGLRLSLAGEALQLDRRAKEAAKTDERLAAREKALLAHAEGIHDRLKRNGEAVVQTEKNLRTIEHYVKRLQRHYDKLGLNVDVLRQFNVKRDRT